jgi:hypothetical protein
VSTATSIEWTQTTWNPTTGCDRISPGCDHCYALTLAKRLKAMGQPKYQTDGDPRTSGPGFGVAMHQDVLAEPLRWRKPRVVFVDSMADIAHAKVSRAFLVRVWATMAATPQHTYQILTKRPERPRALLTDQGCGCPHSHEPGRHFRTAVAAEAARLGGGARVGGRWSVAAAERVAGHLDRVRRVHPTGRGHAADAGGDAVLVAGALARPAAEPGLCRDRLGHRRG